MCDNDETAKQIAELHGFVIGQLKPLLEALAESPMASMIPGVGTVSPFTDPMSMPPPPLSRRRR